VRRALALILLVVAFAIAAEVRAADLPRVEGTVVDAVTGQPVKKAAVTIQRIGRMSQGTATYVVLTDQAGHFAFAGIAAGDWGGIVQRDGYVSCSETGAGSDAKPLRWQVEADTVLKDRTIRLIPTGVIVGRVVDADDEPVAGASVGLTGLGAKARWQQFPDAKTNDLGEYRLYNIPSGKYIVTVTYQPPWQQANTRLSQGTEQYVTTYYPSTPDRGQATPVAVGMGALVQGVQIRLARESVVRVRGQVMQAASAGNVSSQWVSVELSQAQEAMFGGGGLAGVTPQPDGVFEFNGVRPGRYVLRARSWARNSCAARQLWMWAIPTLTGYSSY
jgi:Carboxypeptidase regulatory-like domain